MQDTKAKPDALERDILDRLAEILQTMRQSCTTRL